MYTLERPDTPPTDDDQFQTDVLKVGDVQDDSLPLTPRSSFISTDEEVDWSLKDDKELLIHVLGSPLKHVKWKQVEQNFEDRHLAKMCADRWEYLKTQLLKDIHVL